ncbi:MAG: DUF3619 family protein [Candidatus Accumulibacter sp.]|jgi:hypothetical protein|nr:DUF3619 family protein [Accumulibacter sp.]
MNELHFAYRLRQHLNRGLRELDPATLDRLSAARRAALARHEQAAIHPARAAVDGFLSLSCFGGRRLGQALAVLVFVSSILGSTLWIANLQAQELGGIDSAILSDELPIGVFIDEGFAVWLACESSK